MAVKKIDYSKTIIYKIVCKDLSVPDCYVGSTTQFRQRKSQHRRTCNNLNSKKYNYPLYKFIRENGGFENFDMIEIEKYPCTDGNESRSRERHYFELLNANLNKVKPLITEDELKQIHKEYKQTEQYKEYNKLYCKKYREEHIDEIKIYREEHKENEKKYREENREKIHQRKTEKITCICGLVISRNGKSAHEKTFIHISRTKPLFKPTDDEIIHA